jgi:hypothetical protein
MSEAIEIISSSPAGFGYTCILKPLGLKNVNEYRGAPQNAIETPPLFEGPLNVKFTVPECFHRIGPPLEFDESIEPINRKPQSLNRTVMCHITPKGYKPAGGNGKMHHWRSDCVLVLRPLSI